MKRGVKAAVIWVRIIRESVAFAVHSLISNKLRTILSLLGITIGIFAIVSVFTVVDSLGRTIKKNISELGDNVVYNEEEIARLLQLARDGYADMVAVGNEVLYRDDLTEDELINYIVRVKKELPGIMVGYVDAYYEFCNRPALTEACDVIFANCFPLWEGCPIDYSLLYVKDMYHRAVKAAKGKKVIISETGWPNRGSSIGDAEPSLANAIRYFVNIQNWAQEDDVDVFYFSAFDELWKMYDEGDLGAYWGLWDMNGRLKYSK